MNFTKAVFLIFLISGCANQPINDVEELIGVWQFQDKHRDVTYFEFKPDGTGTYNVFITGLKCDCKFNFSWSLTDNGVSTVRYDSFDYQGEPVELVIEIDLIAKFSDGKLASLRPKEQKYLLKKKA